MTRLARFFAAATDTWRQFSTDAAVLLAAARVLRAGNTCPQPIDLGAAT